MRAHRGFGALAEIGEGDLGAPRAFEDDLAYRCWQGLPGLIEVELVERGQALQHLEIKRVAPIPAANRATGKAELGKLHDPARIEIAHLAQAVAVGTGAGGVVERKEPRFERGQRPATVRAGEAIRKARLVGRLAFEFDHERAPRAQAQGGFERFGQAGGCAGTGLEAVDNGIDRMAQVARQRRQRVEFVQHRWPLPFGSNANAREALCAQALEELQMLPFARRHQRRQDHDAHARGPGSDGVDHLRNRLRGQRLVGVTGAVGRSRARVEQAQVVVDFGHRANSRARVMASRFLLDGDRWGKALDPVDVRLFH